MTSERVLLSNLYPLPVQPIASLSQSCYNLGMTSKRHHIIIPTDLKPRPKPHEESAAIILSNHFNSDVRFISKRNYGSPDVSIRGIEWEIKSPTGDGKNNIRKNMREATHQSSNIVIIVGAIINSVVFMFARNDSISGMKLKTFGGEVEVNKKGSDGKENTDN